MYSPGVALRSHRMLGQSSRLYDRTQTVQRIALLSKDFGRALQPRVLRQDPFYALHDIFTFVAVSERQFLSSIAVQINRKQELLLSESTERSRVLQSDLIYFWNLLEDHIKNISEANRFIQNRRFLQWPRSHSDKSQHTALKLQLDFETLLEKAKQLQERCEKVMEILINRIQLSDILRGVARSKQNFRLTLLAALFVPITVTATIFGMNFITFVSNTNGTWIWLLTTVPVMLISFLLVVWEHDFISELRANLLGKLRGKQTNLYLGSRIDSRSNSAAITEV